MRWGQGCQHRHLQGTEGCQVLGDHGRGLVHLVRQRQRLRAAGPAIEGNRRVGRWYIGGGGGGRGGVEAAVQVVQVREADGVRRVHHRRALPPPAAPATARFDSEAVWQGRGDERGQDRAAGVVSALHALHEIVHHGQASAEDRGVLLQHLHLPLAGGLVLEGPEERVTQEIHLVRVRGTTGRDGG